MLLELEHLLEKLGEVNLSAIEEFEATTERYDFLIAQQQDLTEAVLDLTEAMQHRRNLKAIVHRCIRAH